MFEIKHESPMTRQRRLEILQISDRVITYVGYRDIFIVREKTVNTNR